MKPRASKKIFKGNKPQTASLMSTLLNRNRPLFGGKMSRLAIIVFFLLVFFAAETFAVQAQTTTNWVVPQVDSLRMNFTVVNRCMANPGSQNVYLTVFDVPGNTLNSNSTVTATVFEPDGDQNSISFSSQGDGNYLKAYTFDVNGTYKFAVHSVDNSNASIGDLNSFVYVGNFDMNISFVNNGQSHDQGATGTIRNKVLNTDGNLFVGLTGTTTIYYPDSSTFVNSGSMTEITYGEYSYNFTVPSTAGNYTATSSFTCGSNTDSNTAGRFTVNAASTGGTTGGTSGGTSGGSTGGSGGGGGDPNFKAGLRGLEIEPLELGAENFITIIATNGASKETQFIVQLQIARGSKVDFYTEKPIPYLGPGKSMRITFEEAWLPQYAGSYIFTLTLVSADKSTKFAVTSKKIDLVGEFRYDLEAICNQTVAAGGIPFYFNILASNMGDYYEDVDLSWWIEDEAGKTFGFSSEPVAIVTSTTLTKNISVLIPENTKPGKYRAKTRLVINDVEKNGACEFTVRSPPVYYDEVLNQLEEQAKRVFENLNEKTSQGHITDYLLDKTRRMIDKINELRQKSANAEYAQLNTEIVDVIQQVNEITELEAGLTGEASLEILGLEKVIAVATVVSIIILLIYTFKPFRANKIGKKGIKGAIESAEKKLERLLGLEE